jgi:predicted DNA-binding protein (UPF0251 family)
MGICLYLHKIKAMARIKCERIILGKPHTTYYKPAGIPMKELDEVVLELDEFEAIRLADLDGNYQEDAAKKMQISRQTFGRIIASAHFKIANAIIHGTTLKIGN